MPCPPPELYHRGGSSQLRLLPYSGVTSGCRTTRPHTSGDIPEPFNRFPPDKEVYPMCKALPTTEQQTAVLFDLFGGGREETKCPVTSPAVLAQQITVSFSPCLGIVKASDCKAFKTRVLLGWHKCIPPSKITFLNRETQ